MVPSPVRSVTKVLICRLLGKEEKLVAADGRVKERVKSKNLLDGRKEFEVALARSIQFRTGNEGRNRLRV